MVIFNGDISFKKPNFENLSHMGGFFNIVTSLTGVATVWLLAKAIIIQRTELDKVSSSMDEQNEKLQTQIRSSEIEEKINRTMKYFDEWLEIQNLNLSEPAKDLNDAIKKQESLKYYIDRITMIKGSKLNEYLDLDILKELLVKAGALKTLELAIIQMEGRKHISKSQYEKNLHDNKIKLRNASDQSASLIKQAISDGELSYLSMMQTYDDEIQAFKNSMQAFKDAFL